jgi:hypothetical protein
VAVEEEETVPVEDLVSQVKASREKALMLPVGVLVEAEEALEDQVLEDLMIK